MDFQIDFGAFKPAPSAPTGPLFASVGGRVSSLSNDEVVFYDPVADKAHVMTQQVLQALDQCRPFRTMDEHVARVAEALPQLKGQQAAVRRVLEGLASRGLLLEGGAFLQRFAAADAAEPAPFAGFHVRACNRPAQLQRLLDGLAQRERAHGGGHAVTLVDDSTGRAEAGEHARLLQAFGAATGLPVRYVGEQAWQQAIARLQQALPEHAGAIGRMLGRDPGFAGRRGGGTGKNLASLLTAGRRYALLDDDFLFPLHRHPEYRPGLRFDTGGTAPRSFASVDDALGAGEDAGDVLALHLGACGARLGAVANHLDGMRLGPAELRELVPSRLPHLDPQARILATINGHRGDAGASGMAWLFALPEEARAGFSASREAWTAALERPAVWQGAARFQVLRGATFTPFLVDNGSLMPCTSPYGRGEDALFAALAGALWREGVVLDTPFAIGHLQEGARGRPALLARPETPDINLCIAEFVRHAAGELQGLDPLRRNAALVALLRDLADAGSRELVAYLREFLAYLRTNIVHALQKNLAASRNPPVWWAADLRRAVEANGRALADAAPPRFAGWPEDADEAACVAAFRRELCTLADGLEAWPALWQLARDRGPDWLLA
jgi:hypothetical protein